MHFNYEMSRYLIDKMPLTIKVTMTVEEWRQAMRNKNDEFTMLIAQVLGDITRLSEQKYELPREVFDIKEPFE